MAEFDEAVFRGKTTEIDLAAMKKVNGNCELNKDGFMEIKNGSLSTTQNFNIPLKIELRAKTDRLNLSIKNENGSMTFNWDDGPTSLIFMNFETKEWITYKNSGSIPVNEFVDIEYILGREITVVKVNGELRHIGSDFQYIRAYKENPEFSISAPVNVSTWPENATQKDSMITVESLRITEL